MTRGIQYHISYYELDELGRLDWENTLDTQIVTGADVALAEAKEWLNADEPRKVRTIIQPGGDLCLKAHPMCDTVEDVAAVIERYYVDHAGVENI